MPFIKGFYEDGFNNASLNPWSETVRDSCKSTTPQTTTMSSSKNDTVIEESTGAQGSSPRSDTKENKGCNHACWLSLYTIVMINICILNVCTVYIYP